MALISISGDDCASLEQRLKHCCPEHSFGNEGSPALYIQQLARWRPSWCPPAAHRPLLLISPREPADPIAAYLTGIDAWLPDNCSDEELTAQIAAMLRP